MRFVLVPLRELTAVQYGEHGVPYLVTTAGALTAICSKFPLLYWPGRASYSGQSLRERVVMRWDGDGEHLLTCVATRAGDDIVRAYVVHGQRGGTRCSVERRSLAGEQTWRHDVGAGATALCAWPAAGAIAFALLDGTFGVCDVVTGAVLHEERFALDGAPTIVTALAVHDETIVLGTIQGRLVLYALS